MLAVGLGSTVFLWNAQDSSVRPWPRPPRAGGRAALAPTGLARRGRQRPCGACCAPVCRACSRPGMRRRGIKLGARARARPPRAGVAQHSVCARGHAALMRSASALWGAGGCCACGSRRTPAATRRGGGRGSRSCAAAGSLPASPAAAAGRAGGVAGRCARWRGRSAAPTWRSGPTRASCASTTRPRCAAARRAAPPPPRHRRRAPRGGPVEAAHAGLVRRGAGALPADLPRACRLGCTAGRRGGAGACKRPGRRPWRPCSALAGRAHAMQPPSS